MSHLGTGKRERLKSIIGTTVKNVRQRNGLGVSTKVAPWQHGDGIGGKMQTHLREETSVSKQRPLDQSWGNSLSSRILSNFTFDKRELASGLNNMGYQSTFCSKSWWVNRRPISLMYSLMKWDMVGPMSRSEGKQKELSRGVALLSGRTMTLDCLE